MKWVKKKLTLDGKEAIYLRAVVNRKKKFEGFVKSKTRAGLRDELKKLNQKGWKLYGKEFSGRQYKQGKYPKHKKTK